MRLVRDNAGYEVRSYANAGFRVSERQYDRLSSIQPHAHQHLQIYLVLEGGFIEQVQNKTLDCGPGSVAIRPAMALHSDAFGESPPRTMTIEFMADQRLAFLSSRFESAAIEMRHAIRAAARQVYDELRSTDTASPLALEAATLRLAATLLRLSKEDQQPDWLMRAKEILQEETAARITARQLAHRLGVGRTQLFEGFKRYEQCGIRGYVRKLRLNRARDLLAESTMSVCDIAAAVGFFDHAHFDHAFRREFLESPAMYRRRLRQSQQ